MQSYHVGIGYMPGALAFAFQSWQRQPVQSSSLAASVTTSLGGRSTSESGDSGKLATQGLVIEFRDQVRQYHSITWLHTMVARVKDERHSIDNLDWMSGHARDHHMHIWNGACRISHPPSMHRWAFLSAGGAITLLRGLVVFRPGRTVGGGRHISESGDSGKLATQGLVFEFRDQDRQ